MERVIRFGVSVEPDLLRKFDMLIQKEGYSSRSEAIRDMIRKEILANRIKNKLEEVVGTITIVYDHENTNLTTRLLDIQHTLHKNIVSSMHVHLDEHNCLETIIVQGKMKDVKRISDCIRSIKGVKHGELTVTKREF